MDYLVGRMWLVSALRGGAVHAPITPPPSRDGSVLSSPHSGQLTGLRSSSRNRISV